MRVCAVLAVLAVLVLAAPRGVSARNFECADVLALTARPDQFTFDAAEAWASDSARGVDCCAWVGVTCGGHDRASISEIVLRDARGNASAITIPFAVSHMRYFIAPNQHLHGLPHLLPCSKHESKDCPKRIAIFGPLPHERAPGDVLPHVTLPSWREREEAVNEVFLTRVNVTSIPRGLFLLWSSVAMLTVEDALVGHGHVMVERAHMTLVDVRGVTHITAGGADGTVRHTGVFLRALPDLTHMDGTWHARACDGDEAWHLKCTVRVEACPQLVKLPHVMGGPGSLAFGDLPRLGALPHVGSEIIALHVQRLPPRVVTHMGVPLGSAASLREVHLVYCELLAVPALPASVRIINVAHNRITTFPNVFMPRNASVVLADGPAINVTLSHNPVNTLPAQLPLMLSFACRACNLTGFVDVTHAQVDYVDLSRNALRAVRLAGTERVVRVSDNALEEIQFPGGAMHMTLVELHARNNRLRSICGREAYDGQLPMKLRVLDVAGNELVGLARFSLPASLWYLDVSRNNLSKLPLLGTPNAVLNVHGGDSYNGLRVFNASHNAFTSIDTTLYAHTTQQDNAFEVLDVSHNALTDWNEVRRVLTGAQNMHTVLVQHNRLRVPPHPTTEQPFFPNAMPSLEKLLLDHNRFEGVVPDLIGAAPGVKEISLVGSGWSVATEQRACRNHDMVHAPECMGHLRPLRYALHRNGTSLCPVLALYHGDTTLEVALGPDVHKYWMCRCQFGHYVDEAGDGSMLCRAAPHNTICPGGHRSTEVWPAQGHWLSAETCVDEAVHAAHCPREYREWCAPGHDVETIVSLSQDADAPTLSQCSSGYTGRMCSACDAGHFRWGNTCWKCASNADSERSGVVFGVLGVAALVLGVAYWLPARGDAAFRITLLAVQLTALTTSVHSHFMMPLQRYLHMWGMALFDMPYLNGCLESHSAFRDVESAVVVSALAVGVPAAVWVVGWLLLRARGAGADKRAAWWTRSVRAACILVWLVFQRAAAVLPMYFQCEDDACTGASYFARFPFQRCDGWMAASVSLFCLFVLPLPLLVFAWARVRGTASIGESDRTAYGFLTNGYKPQWAWYEATYMLLKLLVGLFAGLVVSDRLFSPYLVFVMLLGAYYAQHVLLPYESTACNVAAGIVLGIEACMFAVAAASNVLTSSVGLGSVIIMAHTAMIGVVVLHLISVLSRSTGKFGLLTPFTRSEGGL